MNQPSDEALRRMIRYLLKTNVPRLIEKEGEKNENQSRRMEQTFNERKVHQDCTS